jgi:hypothetical protein
MSPSSPKTIRLKKLIHHDWLVVLLLTTGVLSCSWIYREFAQDDAFITYRYARNLVNGHGFVYNPGENILGTTTPLYTLLLASLGKLTGQDIQLISHLVSTFSLWLAGVTLYYLGKESGILLAAATALVFTTNAFLITAIGMETLLLLALMLLALKSYLSERFCLTGFLLGLLLLTRYEMILFAGLLGTHFLIRRRKLPVWLLGSVVVALPWLTYAWCTFGHVMPQSALTKLAGRATGHGYPFAVGAILWWHVYTLQNLGYYLLVPLILLGAYSAVRRRLESQGYSLLLAWSVIYFLAASLTAGSFSWYYGPLIPGISILLVWGTRFLASLGSLDHLRPSIRILQMTLFALVTLGILVLQASSWVAFWTSYQGEVKDTRYVLYRQVAQWLDQHANDHEILATEEIGALGYYTDLRIVDLYGLVSPAIQPWLERSRTETLKKAIELYDPDYIVTARPDFIQVLQESPLYRPEQAFGDQNLILYRRY